MKFEIHQTSWVNGQLVDTSDGPKTIDIVPLAKRGETVEHWPLDKDEPETVVLTDDMHHIPGPHWKPLDPEAKALCQKHGVKFTGQVPDVLKGLQRKLAETEATRLHPDSAGQLATGIVRALIEAGLIEKPVVRR